MEENMVEGKINFTFVIYGKIIEKQMKNYVNCGFC